MTKDSKPEIFRHKESKYKIRNPEYRSPVLMYKRKLISYVFTKKEDADGK